MKNLRIIITTLSLLLLSLPLLTAQSVRASGNVVKQDRSVSDFTGIEVDKGIDVYLAMGAADKVVVEADDNVIDHVLTEVRNGNLDITLDKGIRNATKLTVYVTLAKLEHVGAASGSDVESEGTLKAENLTIDASGGADIELDLEANEVTLNISGGADVELNGETTVFKANASGGSDINARGFKAAKVWLQTSGGADAHVHASEEIHMEASGASDIYYRGGAKVVKSRTSGGADIHGN